MNGGGSVGSVSSADPASPRSSLLWNNIYVPPEVVDICFRGRQRPLHATVLLRHFTKFLSQLRRKCISNSYFLHISCLPLTTQIFILSWIFLSSVHVHRTPCCRQSHMTVGAWGESCPRVQSSCVQCASACTTKPTSDLQCFNFMPLHVCEHLQKSPADFSSHEQQVALPSIHCVFPRDTANTASSAISKSHFALTQLHTRITQTVMLCADAISRSDSSLVCWLGSWTFVNTSVCWLLLSRSVRSGFYQGTHCSPAGPEPDDFTM